VRGKIVHRHISTDLFDHAHNGFRDLTLIKRCLSLLRDDLECSRQIWVTKNFSGFGASAINR
jgi:hypothetical protein